MPSITLRTSVAIAAIEARHLEAFDAAGLCRAAGIVEQAIDSAELLHGLADQGAHLFFDGDVGLAKDAVGAESFRQRLAFRRAAAGDHDFRPFRDKNFRGPQPDAARRTGDHRNLAVEPCHVASPAADYPVPIFPAWPAQRKPCLLPDREA